MRRAGADSAILLSVAPSLCPSVGMIPKIRSYTPMSHGQIRSVHQDRPCDNLLPPPNAVPARMLGRHTSPINLLRLTSGATRPWKDRCPESLCTKTNLLSASRL
jgi:hypothetical protein